MRILKSQIDGLTRFQRYRQNNQPQRTEYMRKWRARNPEKAIAAIRRSWNKHKHRYLDQKYLSVYGITRAQAEILKKRPCEVCGESIKPRRIDHDHSIKEPHVRGILCDGCNLAIGHIEKRGGDKLLAYLRKWGKIL